MPKRKASPIVPQAEHRVPKRKSKAQRVADAKARDAEFEATIAAAQAATQDYGGNDVPPLAAPPPEVSLLTVDKEFRADVNALALATSPDRSDKPERFLAWLLAPMTPEQFFDDVYEQKPVHLRRTHEEYYRGFFSTAELDRQLAECSLKWTEELDVTHYADGVRRTLNGDGVVSPAEVKARFGEGCSIRLSWPQRHSDAVWAMLALIEERFGAGAGANVYATPAGCQGFAPHWDDINAFVLQLEGEKRWRLYAPRSEEERLPRFSSPNLAQDELGPLVADITLSPGDLLYLPRGIVHQAVSGASDSLHMTVSVGRQHSWRDLLELGVMGALETAALEHPPWRESLPPDFAAHMGVQHADASGEEADAAPGAVAGAPSSRRAELGARLRGMLSQLVETMPIDAICDQFLARRFLFDRLPPRLAPADAKWVHVPEADVTLDSRLRLVSRHAARLAVEDGFIALYFCTHNTRVHHGVGEPQHIDFALEAAPALEAVLAAYPKFVAVSRLPADNDGMRLDIARALVEARAVLVRPPKDEPELPRAAKPSSEGVMAQRAAAGQLVVPRKSFG